MDYYYSNNDDVGGGGGKGHRISVDTAGRWFRNRPFCSRKVGGAIVERPSHCRIFTHPTKKPPPKVMTPPPPQPWWPETRAEERSWVDRVW